MGNCWCKKHYISGNISGNTSEDESRNNLQLEEIKRKEYFIIERPVIDGINIGILSNVPYQNINNQGIRVSEFGNDVRRLVKYSGDGEKLFYKFEKNTKLTIYREDNVIMIHLEANGNTIKTYLGKFAIRLYQPIGIKGVSDDLDKIYWFIRNNNEYILKN